MKIKINKELLKSSVLTCFFVVLFNFFFSIIAFLLIWYWVIPNISTIVPVLKKYLESLSDEFLPIAYDIVYAISACIAIFPSAISAYRMSKKRKKEFLAYSKGCISYIDGIKYHIAQYGVYDIICTSALIILLTFIYMIAGDVFIVRFFPLVFCMFSRLGIILGFIVSFIFTALSMFCGIFFSQKKWRAEYFISE